MKELKQVPVIMETDQVIRGLDYITIKTMDYFSSSVNKEALDIFIKNLPFYKTLDSNELRLSLLKFLCRNKAIFGLRHCDTQECEDSWRIQLQINIQVFPRVLELLLYKKEKSWLISYVGNNLVTLTFSISKNENNNNQANNL